MFPTREDWKNLSKFASSLIITRSELGSTAKMSTAIDLDFELWTFYGGWAVFFLTMFQTTEAATSLSAGSAREI